jgi:drug/metabolite transporter (DMT)-like permease
MASLVRVKLVQKVGIQFMSQVAYLIPIFAIFWSWIFLNEIPKLTAWIALFLILSGLLVRKLPYKKDT